MAQRTVTRSNGVLVELKLNPVSNFRDRVVINIPKQPYNARFTFVRKVSGRNPWVELVTREILDPNQESLLHVSKPVFYGMAEWACAILNAKRVIGKTGSVIEVTAAPITWSVLWRATDGDHEVTKITAVSAKQARYVGWQQWTGGNLAGITFDLMYAVPALDTKYVRASGEAVAAKASPKNALVRPTEKVSGTQLALQGV